MSARRQPRRERVPYIILLAALAITAATARYAYDTRHRQDRMQFEMNASAVAADIGNRLDAYIAMLLGGAGLFAASDAVSRDEFRAYVARLDLARRYPGIQGVGFSLRVREHERAAVLAAIRRERSDFRFWPDQPGRDINAIVYLEPAGDRNEVAFGYDMGAEANRRDAMDRARDQGLPAATGIVRLVQEPAESAQAGFLIYVPVYRQGQVPSSLEERRSQLEGFVYSPFRAGDLLAGILDPEVREILGLEIFDSSRTGGGLLHRSRDHTGAARFTVEEALDVAGRTWTVVVRGGDDPATIAGSWIAVGLVAVGGVMLSFLLFAVTRGQVVARLAAERTAEVLRESEERLRAANRAKDDFLATISHELRTPLNAIVGWTSMLARGVVPAHMQSHAVSVIARNAAAQTRLIEDLLDMSRAAAGHLTLRIQEVDARATIEAAVESVRPMVSDAGLRLNVTLDQALDRIEADAGRLQQIVANLLSNSIKFTPPEGYIDIEAGLNEGLLVLRVEDTGIGIDQSFMPFVFDRFRQADSSSTRQHSGTGLGLAITRHLVELHGGSVAAASPGPGKGTTFEVRLPVRQRSGSGTPSARQPLA